MSNYRNRNYRPASAAMIASWKVILDRARSISTITSVLEWANDNGAANLAAAAREKRQLLLIEIKSNEQSNQ